MKFNLDILQHYLLVNQGVLPEKITLGTEFGNHLGMSHDDIKQMLGFITRQTGVRFQSDSCDYLTDVFDLLIHMVVRSVEVEITEEQFGYAPDAERFVLWHEFLHKKFKLPNWTAQLN